MWKITLLLLAALFFAHAALAQPTPTPSAPFVDATQSPTSTPTVTRTPTHTPTIPPTPAPTTDGFATGGSGEVLFPEAIYFMVRLSRPANELRSARLTIDTEVQTPTTLEFEVDEITLYSDPEALLVYVWTIPQNAIPPLFSTVEFIWEVEAEDGETALVEGTVDFTDQRVVWVTNSEMEGRLIVSTAREVPVGLARNLRPVYELLARNMGSSPELRYLVYDASVSPGCALRTMEEGEELFAISPFSSFGVPCRLGFAERVYQRSGYTVFQRLPGLDVETTIVEDMVQTFYRPIWDDTPGWFAEGLSLFYAPALKTDLLPIVQTAGRSNRLFSLDVMSSRPPEDAALRQLWQAQSYGMVLYIAELAGVEGIFALADAVGEGQPFSEAYQNITGQSLEALLPAWQSWIFTRRAETVYGITPYQPSTPTFTPTLTDTLTRTPTATSTSTPTVTPSVTGVLSPTPYPTATPSQTLTPEPPTNTPRPPVQVPSPTPTSPVTALTMPGVQAGVVFVLLIVIVILVYVYIRVGRR